LLGKIYEIFILGLRTFWTAFKSLNKSDMIE